LLPIVHKLSELMSISATNSMNRIYLVAAFVLTASSCFSQKYFLSGYISDSETGEKLVGANISVFALKVGTITNEFGYYSLALPADSLQIDYITLGYEKKTILISLKKDMRLDVELTFSNILQELTVTPDDENDIVNSTQMSVHRITNQIIQKSTMLLGEGDILKSLQLLPGVKGGNDGFAGIYIRGGTPDQNLMLLDGIPVYNVNHLFGFLSTFNTDIVKDAVLYKGGIPARFGNRLSSVVDISLKDGNSKEKQGTFSLSPIAGRISFEGPVKRNVSSYIVSLRRTWFDQIFTAFSPAGQKAAYFFYDLNFKYNHTVNSRNKFAFSIYAGKDKFYSKIKSDGEKSEYGFNWNNAAYSLRWNTVYSPRLYATYIAYQSNYNFIQESQTYSNATIQSRRVKSKIRDRSIQADFEYEIFQKSKIRFGSKMSFLSFSPEITQIINFETDTTLNNSAQQNSINSEFYIEQDSKLTDDLLINFGLREGLFTVKNKTYSILQPRVSITYLISKKTSLKGSINKMGQFLHLLTNSSIGFPTDLWVPSTDKTVPEKSIQYAFGINQRLVEKSLEGSIEVYYKTMRNLLEYQDGANYLFGSKNWEDKITYGRGSSYGIEFFINKKKGILTGWVGYTLSKSDRVFAEINNGEKFPFKYDRRHDLSVYGNYSISQAKSFSLVFVLSSGNLATLPVNSYKGLLPPNYNLTPRYQSGNYSSDFASQDLIVNRNNYRLPIYHRLDLNYQTSKTTKHNNTRTWVFSVYNAYSRLNPFLLYQAGAQLKKLALFPIVPSISYKLDF